jgi:two-component system chemotaxis response regulator CheY
MDHSSKIAAPAPAAVSAARRVLRILYAEDLTELRDLAQTSLAREGHGIECLADGALALDRVLSAPAFDLVITDHHMPNMNGLEFVTKLREHSFLGKIMVFSSELSEGIAAQYRQQHVDRILYKPVFPAMLRKTLGELFPATASAVPAS